jgi:SAM-dependent methyltransferase
MPLRRLENASERLDAADHEPGVLARDFDRVEEVNRWLGGLRSVRLAIEDLVRPGCTLSVLDVGCGSADVPRSISRFGQAAACDLSVVAIDRHVQIIALGRQRTPAAMRIRFVCADGLSLPFPDRSFDVATMSLALHHFDGVARAAMLRELARVALRRVVISDLERCWPNYLGARLLAITLWLRNPLARHDGPVSVLRAFTAPELTAELEAAGLENVRVVRRFFYRLVASGSARVV